MNRKLWQIGAVADHLNGLFHIHMHIAEGADPVYQPLQALQSCTCDELLWVNSQRLHCAGQGSWLDTREAALGVPDDQDLAHTKQINSASQRADQIVRGLLAFELRNSGAGGTQ